MKKKESNPLSYSEAGVDIDRGDRFARAIGKINSSAVSPGIGGFAGGLSLPLSDFENPVLLSTTDGVGTKLLVAKNLQKYSTIGIDLVAMCVNDLIVCNAAPVQFLDYIACGRLDEELLSDVIKGIVRGCEEAECVLTGGETAEMPDMYRDDDIDLAGFCVGIAEKEKMLPKIDSISPGDSILGLPSSGIHSNGFSLARKIITPDLGDVYSHLLIPTKIYVQEMKWLLSPGKILAAAHITGGGIMGNLRRVIPEQYNVQLNYSWPVPEIFREIRERGNITREEMYKIFNMGIGMALVIRKEDKELVLSKAEGKDITIYEIGSIEDG